MKKYNLINNSIGWLCFFIAAVTYLLTLEPTASFWDCPEFIAQGTKLEVGHPPGNPIFMLAARFFVTLFGNDVSTAAVAVNTMSALLSAATILLLFWSVTHLIRKLIVRDDAEEISLWKTALIMGGGMCAALSYTWSDTFWFSAVEGEVYAFSSFCTALVVWLMFKWENRADLPHSDRYLVLIAYVIGVSIAVHLLNLLCIPALGLIFYYRKYRNTNATGSLIALGVSCVIVAAILYGLVPGFIQVSQWFELLCVNTFGMSYNMGVLVYAILLVASFIYTIIAINRQSNPTSIKLGIFISVAMSGLPFIGHSVAIGIVVLLALAVYLFAFCRKVPIRIFNTIILSIFVIFIGYSSYALLLIRASANTPMNQNAPDNVFALASYLNREQYGDRPLFFGPSFAEEVVMQEHPQGSGNAVIVVDEYGRPATRILDGYLRDENGGVFNTPDESYTKVVKTSPDEPDRYVKALIRPDYKTMPDLNMFLPRIYSSDERHVQGYKSWSGYSTVKFAAPNQLRDQWAQSGYAPVHQIMPYLNGLETVTTAVDDLGNPVEQTAVWKPGFGENMRYFVNYQLNHMYWRYFMWNFAGRQNDIQGNGEPHLGNWISGIPALDNARLGDQTYLPDEFGKGNKGHNVFYMMPLLLGLIGLLFQALYKHRANPNRGIEQFWVIFFLFFMTGIAIVLYLNQTPGQPRERDYAFAGSFYAFAIWIGLGVPAIGIMLRDLLSSKRKKDGKNGDDTCESTSSKGVLTASAAVAVAVGLIVPLQMVSQTWDDHDRSGRYVARDFGFNYLNSLDDNAVIFTNGDNDTFPLWYAQEVEGVRTDVRVVNLSYLTTDWYANQLLHPTYDAKAVKMLATSKDIEHERMAYSFIIPRKQEPVKALDALKSLYASDDKLYGAPYMETPNVFMPVDRNAAIARYSSGNAEYDSLYIAPYLSDISTTLSGNGLNQSKALSLDMVANSINDNWERPMYFATTVPGSYYLGLMPYLSATGLAYEVTPFKQPIYDVTAEKAYRNIVSRFCWGGLDVPDAEKLYLDETVRRMVSSLRSAIYTSIEGLISTGELDASQASRDVAKEAGLEVPTTRYDMARQLLEIVETKLPVSVARYDSMLGVYLARSYYELYLATKDSTNLDKAENILNGESDRFAQLVKYVSSLTAYEARQIGRSDLYGIQYLSAVIALQNRIAILKAKPELYNPEDPANPFELTIEQDLQLAPLAYVEGLDLENLEKEVQYLDPSQSSIVYRVIALLRCHKDADIDPMAISNELMSKHKFTTAAWTTALNY